MYCPKCREEFREGFTFCERCKENLVDQLPPETKSAEPAQSRTLLEVKKTFCIEKWLKRGAVVYVVVGVLSDISHLFAGLYVPYSPGGSPGISHVGSTYIVFQIVRFCSAVVGSVLWGAFFYGLGKIIDILKAGLGDEQT